MRAIGTIALVLIGLMIFSVDSVFAQEANIISGTVADATTGEPIEGVLVVVDDSDPLLSSETDASGSFSIDGAPAGEHNLTASAEGYESETIGIQVTDTDGAEADFTLQPLEAEEEEPEEGEVQEVSEDQEGKEVGDRQGYVGTFTLGEGTFTVTTKQGDEIEITIPEVGLEGITRMPGQTDPTGGLEDGAEVAVLVEFVDGGAGELIRVAEQIIVKPAPQRPVVGAVVEIVTDEEGVRTLTIMRPDGTTKEVRLGPQGEAPEVGDLVTAFEEPAPDDDNGGSREDGPPVVRGLVRAEEVRQRLEGFLEDLTADVENELTDEEVEERAEQVANVAAILEDHSSRRVDIIEKLSQNENLPPQAMEAISKGIIVNFSRWK